MNVDKPLDPRVIIDRIVRLLPNLASPGPFLLILCVKSHIGGLIYGRPKDV